MIIQCDHCSAKFRMDDSKLANGAVKVRCAKCKEVFVVQPEAPAEPVAPQLQPEPVPVAQGPSNPDEFSFDSTSPAIGSPSSQADDFSFNVETPSINSASSSTEAEQSNEFDWQTGTSSETGEPQTSSDFDISTFNSSIETASSSPAISDGGDFDFGEVDLTVKSASTASQPVSNETDDFSMDFGEVSFSDPSPNTDSAASSALDLETKTASDFAEFGADLSTTEKADEFAFSFNSDSHADESTTAPAKEEQEAVNFGEFSFGEIEDPALPAPSISAPILENTPISFNSGTSPEFPEYADDELPPSSLTSRKKGGSLFPVTLIAGAIIIIIVLAGSGIYFFGGPKAFSKVGLGFLVEWYGDKGGEEGSITLKNVTASYVTNSTAGELFVVRGEAVNNFKKPRASVQIKATLVGPGGPVGAKSAFAGNSLSNEQLATLPLPKIEEIMNNQFGDSLANLGLKPGAVIPFVVVVSPVPKEATDYTVVVGGSTVAAQ